MKEVKRVMQDSEKLDAAIYLVISQSGSILSRIIKIVTKKKYNHISISLDQNMQNMYSFSRRYAHNPIIGGFVMESPFFGSMRRFPKTVGVIMRIPVTSQQYQAISAFLQDMYAEKEKYGYNVSGLLLAGLQIPHRVKNKYYCSEFVRDTLHRFKILDANRFNPITIPEDFLQLEFEIIYIGNLLKYAVKCRN